ncbi:MAG: transposase [Acidobacteria bacterium]|nr:transposase [Acidobacteriota bacterium]
MCRCICDRPTPIDPGETYTAFLLAVVAGARRFAHTALLRADRALHVLLGMERFPTDGTIRNLFKRFTQGMMVRFYEPLWACQVERLPHRAEGYSVDSDATVLERYGEQEGVKKGYNPRKPGRGSHHPLLAVLGEAYFVLHGWRRSGNTTAGLGVVEFLKEALAKPPAKGWIRAVRADSGFLDQALFQYLEEVGLHYIVVARMTRWLKREATQVKQWRALEATCAVGEFQLQLWGWDRARRFVVVREQLCPEKRSPGRKLREVPRAEVFNALNHANFGQPTNTAFTTFGGYSAVAGRITNTVTPARQIQFGLKLLF